MSAFDVKVRKIDAVIPIEDADAIELAQVGGYLAVVQKGKYQAGELALYIPEAAVLPDNLIAELGLEGRLAGSQSNRVKAIKLRGQLSQGIVCRPNALNFLWGQEWGLNGVGIRDWSEFLKIHKWEPTVPVHMSGQVEGVSWIVKWPDLENIKKYPDMFNENEPIIATEKIHGTNVGLCYNAAEDHFTVYSKGLGARGQVLLPSETNVYWRAVQRYNLSERIMLLCRYYDARRLAIFGEVYGQGIQDLHYGATEPAFAAFDVWMDIPNMGGEFFCNAWDAEDIMDAWDIPKVPVLYRGSYLSAFLATYATGKEAVSGKELHMREGLVIRPYRERHGPNGRVIAKIVSDDYLLRKGKNVTEYE